MNSEAYLRVYLLGTPMVEWMGRPLDIPRRKVRALLFYLAVSPEALPRDQLKALFWPDNDETTARRNLSHLSTHLRHSLPEPTILQTTEETLSLDHERVWCDAKAFNEISNISPSLLHPDALQQAVSLYRGTFLNGFSLPDSAEFEAWLLKKQGEFERQFLEMLATLIQAHIAREEYDLAVRCAERYLEVDDLAEDIHRYLISLYALSGSRGAALRQYERCTAILERELGVRPLPETRQVYQAVLEGSPLHPSVLLKAPLAEAPPMRYSPMPLYGREVALRFLEELYARACNSQPAIAIISGEAGIGKTRLIQEFTKRVEREALVLYGSAHPSEHKLPYQPIVEALRSMPIAEAPRLGKISLQLLSRCSQIWLAEVSRILPELLTLMPNLPTPLPAEAEEGRARLFEALTQFVLNLATDHNPLILVLDDLQWADDSTLEWLAYLSRRIKGHRIILLIAYRSEDREKVGFLYSALQQSGFLSEIRLAGLELTSVLHILAHFIAPTPESQAIATRLHRATGGNPFFLIETLRSLSESECLQGDLRTLEEFPLPDTLKQALDARLRRLSPGTRQVLEAAAILGLRFSFDWVHRTSGRAELDTMNSLEELVARRLLTLEGTEYHFVHELVRRVVEESLNPLRRVLLHRRAARFLERLAPEEVSALAHHYDACGEQQKALHYHQLAAQRAESISAWKEAEKHYTRTLELIRNIDPEGKQPALLEPHGKALMARAHLLFLQARLEERDADLSSLSHLATSSGDKGLLLQASMHRVRYLNLDAQYDEAIKTAREGLALAASLSDTYAQSRLLAQIGFAHYFLGEPQCALNALETALQMCGASEDVEMRGRIVHIQGYVYFHLAEYPRSLACQMEALACHQKVGDANRMAWDGVDIGCLYLEMGCFQEAEEYISRYLALARQIGALPVEAHGLHALALLELYQGRYAIAADTLHQALDIQLTLRGEHTTSAMEEALGIALYHLGQLTEAQSLLESAAMRARRVRHVRRVANALIGLSLVKIAAGERVAAQRCLIEAVSTARESLCWLSLSAGLAALACVLRQEGDLARALEHAEEAVRIAQEKALATCEVWGEMENGLILLAKRKPEEALKHTAQAVALAPRAWQRWFGHEEVYYAHARVLLALGHSRQARLQIQQADEIIQAKARHIANPELRTHYLQRTKRAL